MTSLTMGPTLINPELLHTVEDLRRELHRANETLMQQFSTLTTLNETGWQIAGAIEAMLIAHIRNDSIALAECCESYLSNRQRLREKLEESIENTQPRKVH